jgi:hypothetical protein
MPVLMLLLLFNDRIPPMKECEKVAAQCMKIACLVAAQGAGKMPLTVVEARVPPGRYVKNINAPLATQQADKTPPMTVGAGPASVEVCIKQAVSLAP